MSDYVISLIANNPNFHPIIADKVLTEFVIKELGINIKISHYPHNHFVNPMTNLDSVSCNLCEANITSKWGNLMSSKWDETINGFVEDLQINCPECDRQTDLNKLAYVLPAGFTKFTISIFNPSNEEVIAIKDNKARIDDKVGWGYSRLIETRI